MPSEPPPELTILLQAAHAAASQEALKMDRRPLEPDREAVLRAELARLTRRREVADALVATLFPKGVPLDAGLYNMLSRFRYFLGFVGPIEAIVAEVWVGTLRTLKPVEQQIALRAFSQTGHTFFDLHDGLAHVVATISPPASFAADWFPALLIRLRDDGATYGVWKAVERYCEIAPANALSVFEACESTAGSEPHDEIAQRILGTLRTVAMPEVEQQRLSAAAERLEGHPDPARRLLALRSWVHTAWRGGMSRKALESLLAAPGTAQDHDARFSALCRILLAPQLDEECFALVFDWLRHHSTPGLSASAKHELVEAAFSLGTAKRTESRKLPNLWEPLLAIQPIAPEHTGTWGRLQDFLIAVMNGNPAAFEKMVLQLCERSGAEIVRLMQSGDALDGLVSGMSMQRPDGLIARLIFASELLKCRIGLFFFEKLGLHELPADLLGTVSEHELKMALFAFQAAPLHGKVIACFLLAILPRVETASIEVQQEFAKELLLQAKNYPGACLEALRALSCKSPLIDTIISEADAYFAAFRPTREGTPLNSMRVPALEFVARSKRRAISRDITAGAERGSIFAALVKNVDMLYGGAFCSFADGRLDGPTPMQEHTFDMEFPRLEEVDPELMAMRRWHALEQMALIENERSAQP